MDASTFAVGRVTLRSGAVGAAVALRLRAASELQAADLTPTGLPPASVLVVRRLADPMPRRFRAAHGRPRPDWERAVRGALATQARSAARPDAQGRLDPSATAVLFDDETQAIACLMVDRAHGRAASAWWWSALLPRLNLPPAAAGAPRDPAAILVARPREAPAALATVVHWGEAAAIARALTGEGARAALQSLAREHGVPLTVFAQQPEAIADRPTARGGRAERAAARERPTVPWARWVPPAIAGDVIAEVQRLFGVALCVHESPAHLHASAGAERRQPLPAVLDQAHVDRAVSNASTIAELRDTGEHCQSPEAAREQARPVQAARAEATPPSADTPAIAGAKAIPSEALTAPTPEDGMTSRHDASPPLAPKDHALTLAAAAIETTPDVAAAPDSVQGTGVAVPHARVLKRRSSAIATATAAEEPATAVARLTGVLATEGVPTRLGGVFYLIHALDCLHLPAGFERGWRLESSAGPWGTLDLIARALLGATWPPRDPVWDALAHLAGWNASRAERPYRSRLAASAADPGWSAPSTWPAEMRDPLDRIHWSTAGSRVWLWSPDGYVLTHRRTRGDPAASARRASRRFEAAGGARATVVRRPQRQIPWMPPAEVPAGCPARLGRWAATAAPAVFRRLRLAIGDERWRRADRLRIPARLYVTSSHVDVVFTLRDIDLRLRRAGLDRDPGWKPAYGRVVSFHFE